MPVVLLGLAGLLVGCRAVSGPAPADGAGPPPPATTRTARSAPDVTALAERLRRESGAPAVGVVVVDRGGVVELATSGVTRVGGGTAVTDDTPWHLGSNAKAMTAALALALAESGRVSLDDDVAGVFEGPTPTIDREGEGASADVPRPRTEIDPRWGAVTLGDLLAHRGGVAANASLARRLALQGTPETRDARRDRLEIVHAMLAAPPARRPRTRFAYSNLGYVLAGAMLEHVTGEPFETLLDARVFAPLGMRDVVVGAPREASGVPPIVGHRRSLLGRPVAVAPGADNPPFMSPAGGLSLTLADYGRFLSDQLRGARGAADEATLLETASYRRQQTPPDELEGYALGWGVEPDGRLTHAGSNTMWLVLAAISVPHDLAVAIVANDGRIGRLQPSFAAAIDELLERHRPRSVSP